VTELQNELDIKRNDLDALQRKQTQVESENQKLLDQLRDFERESYEINARIRKGMDVEKENETVGRQLDAMRSRERELEREVEELQREVKKKEKQIEKEQARAETMERHG